MAAMLEYELKGKGLKLRDCPSLIRPSLSGDLAETPGPEEGASIYQGFADVSLLQRP